MSATSTPLSSPSLNDTSAFRLNARLKRRFRTLCNLRFRPRLLYGRSDQPAAAYDAERRPIDPMRRILFIVAIVAAFVLIASNINGFMGFRWWSWHQKLTVEVQTPSGLKSASSVAEASWEMPPEWFKIGDSGGGHGEGTLKGEAVTLEVAPNMYLFVLLNDYSSEKAIQSFGELKTFGRNEYKATLDQISSSHETLELPRDKYPLLATFDDINDPASVKRVDPANLEATFGPGYRLKGITLALTKEPVTKGKVEKVLGWLDNLAAYRKDPKNPFTNTLPQDIGYLRNR